MYINMKNSQMKTRHVQRSEETRHRLVDAGIDVLLRHGLRDFSFVKVCDRAGLSRGAIHHHYAAPLDLLSDIVAVLYERLKNRVHTDLKRRKQTASQSEAIDVLWSHLKGNTFRILLEIRVSAASDAALASAISAPSDQLNHAIIQDTINRFQISETKVRVVFASLTGLATQYFMLVQSDRNHADLYATVFIQNLKAVFDGG